MSYSGSRLVVFSQQSLRFIVLLQCLCETEDNIWKKTMYDQIPDNAVIFKYTDLLIPCFTCDLQDHYSK